MFMFLQEALVAKKLYVGNLPFKTSEEELSQLFSQYGEVTSVSIIKDRDNPQRSRGFGFVEMENADEAIAQLNEKDFGGRKLTVNEAREKKPGGRPAGRF